MTTSKRLRTEAFYIEPVLKVYNSFEETNQPDVYKRNYFNIDPAQQHNSLTIKGFLCAFIIGEPGYGKSRFLKQMSSTIGESYRQIDCREFAERRDDVSFPGFTHLLFDGLDEVPPIQFLDSLNRIFKIVESNPNIHVFIACRTHYLERFKSHIAKFNTAKYVQLQPFQERHIREYLEYHLSDANLIEAIISKSTSSPGSNSILKTPRYLEALVRSVLEEHLLPEKVLEMGRTDIFEKVIYFQLRSELEKPILLPTVESGIGNEQLMAVLQFLQASTKPRINVNELQITQRVLEKLAFTMEVYQRNRITETELVTFLDEVQSNINLIFLQHSSIDKFVERTLKKTNGILEFEHTEFQEYLAAKELIRMSDSSQVLYDLILEKDLQVIYSSWLDVLQYAIELDADKIAGSLANYLKINAERQFDERLVDILMGPGIEKASEETKAQLFAAIFDHFQLSGRFLFQRNDGLALLYVPLVNQSIFGLPDFVEFSHNELRQLTNSSLMISSLVRQKRLDAATVSGWKTYLLKVLDIPELKSQYEVWLWTLQELGAGPELRALSGEMLKKEDVQLSIYLETIGRLGADEMMPFFKKVVTTRQYATGKETFLGSLKTEVGISDALEFIIAKDNIKECLFNHEQRFVVFYQLFEQIKSLGSVKVDQLVEKAVYALTGEADYTYYSGTSKAFIDEALEYLLLKDEKFAYRLMKLKCHSDIFQESSDAIISAITLNQFDIIYTELKKGDPWGHHLIYRITSQLAHNGNMGRQALLEMIKVKYPELFVIQAALAGSEVNQKKLEKERLSKEYQRLLMPGTSQIQVEVLNFYQTNKIKLYGIAKTEDVDKMKTFLTNIIDSVKPEKYKVRLDRNGNSTTYKVTNCHWFRFGYYLDMAFKFNLTPVLERNRLKVIKFLPLLNEHTINGTNNYEPLLDFLGEITDEEINELLTFCANRDDDYVFSSISTFSRFISSNKLGSFKPVLVKMLESEFPSLYEREQILNAYGSMADMHEDREYLEAIVAGYDPKEATKKSLAEIANSFLITAFEDKSAIKWRFKVLKNSEEPHQESAGSGTGMMPYLEWEQEYDRPAFAKCFDNLTDGEVVKGMQELLSHSLKTRKKPDMKRYSDYLQLIIFEYFLRYCTLEVINSLRSILEDKNFERTKNSFKGYLRNLEISYVNSHEVYRTISEPVKKFNELKARQYLPVADSASLAGIMDLAIEDMKDFISNKGYQATANQLSNTIIRGKTSLYNEDILQKTFKVQLENSLLKRGIRDTDIHREIELFDGKRLDILLKYGFIGPIMAELKLLKNPEITDKLKRQKYKLKLKQYIAASNSYYAYYIVFNTSGINGTYQSAFTDLVKEYEDIPNLKILMIDCVV